MPFYEYRCDACGYEFEAMQKMQDQPLADCPQCSQPSLVKLISAAGFRLKGGGWYETDFKRGNQKNLHDNGAKSDTAKGDGKPSAAKKDTTKQSTAKGKDQGSGASAAS